MAQPNFRDPIVVSGPTLIGAGNGTLAIDRLTHFTTAQTYSLTCIAKNPDTIFSVVGSLDGPVGIASVGIQFRDDDSKIFLTLQQGSTVFEVGDVFTVQVDNGTDLNQDNIDDYDEQPQKNFGAGLKGTLSGDQNIRYSDDDAFARLKLHDLRYVAAVAGEAGNDVQIQYIAAIPAIPSTLVVQDITLTAVAEGTLGDGITFEYVDYTPGFKAQVTIQNVKYQSQFNDASGNAVSVEYVNDVLAGAEFVSVTGNAIAVHFESGVTTANTIISLVDAHSQASLLVDASLFGSNGPQTAPISATFLTGGSDPIGEAGDEFVSVVGNAITVKMQSGVSTATQIKSKLDASVAASALVTTAVSGTGSNPQTAPFGPSATSGGVDSIGVSAPLVTVVGDLIRVQFTSGAATAQDIVTALAGSGPATALVTASVVGNPDEPQFTGIGPINLTGGSSKFFALNKHEITESGDFVEGNASLLAHDLTAQGDLEVAGNANFESLVSLNDQNSLNLSGNPVPNLQRYINAQIQNEKISLRTADHSAVLWSIPNFSFDDDIVIDFNDTSIENRILAAESPISIPDGQSLYVILDREHNANLTPQVGLVPETLNAYRIATRHGDNLILADNTLVRDNRTARIGEGGGSGGSGTRVDLYDPVSTSLPTIAPAIIDGETVVSDQLVLFTNLSSGNNRVYQATVSGGSISWIAQSAFGTGIDPIRGDDVTIILGDAFGLSHGIFDGSDFKFNDTVRFFNGTDYWELSSLKTASLAASTTGNVFTVQLTGSENMVVDYSLVRGLKKETGTIHITSDGTNVAVTTTGAYIGISGVSFSGDILSGNLRLRFTADASSGVTTMKYFVRRWSDSAGGPGGIPSYATSGPSGISAAGLNTYIQFNDGGNLGSDSDFTWDQTTDVLQLAGLEITGLSAPVVLNDNVGTPATAFQYNAANNPFAIIEFSVLRDGVYQVGRMLIANDGTNASLHVEHVSTGTGTGITFLASVSGGQVLVQYLSTSTTFSAQLKYSMRRWS